MQENILFGKYFTLRMPHMLRLLSTLLILSFFVACQPENPLLEENQGNIGFEEAMVGKWKIKRHSVVIKGGALQSKDAGYFDLMSGGKGEAVMTHNGSKHDKVHEISWSYDEDKKEITIDHKKGDQPKVYKVKDKTELSQKWQKEEFKSNGDLEKLTEILLEK